MTGQLVCCLALLFRSGAASSSSCAVDSMNEDCVHPVNESSMDPTNESSMNEMRSRKEFRKRIKEARAKSGLSKKEFDKRMGFPPVKRGGNPDVQRWHAKWSQPRP